MPLIEQPFRRLDIRYSITGGTRAVWTIERLFEDPAPHTFTLQGAYGPVETADWAAIGLPIVDGFEAYDDERRTWGNELDWHYRVKLETETGTYYSRGVRPGATLDYRAWRIWRDMLRKEKLRLSRYVSTIGWLLKRKRYGAQCPDCVHPLTQEITDSHCAACGGTGLVGGYYAAVPYEVDFPPVERTEDIDDGATTGHRKMPISQGCRVAGDLPLDSYDVFVSRDSDVRYAVRKIRDIAAHRGYIVAQTFDLHQLPHTDAAYAVAVP